MPPRFKGMGLAYGNLGCEINCWEVEGMNQEEKLQPPRGDIEALAEAIWQAESFRASGAGRREPWTDLSDEERERYRFMARIIPPQLAAVDAEMAEAAATLREFIKAYGVTPVAMARRAEAAEKRVKELEATLNQAREIENEIREQRDYWCDTSKQWEAASAEDRAARVKAEERVKDLEEITSAMPMSGGSPRLR